MFSPCSPPNIIENCGLSCVDNKIWQVHKFPQVPRLHSCLLKTFCTSTHRFSYQGKNSGNCHQLPYTPCTHLMLWNYSTKSLTILHIYLVALCYKFYRSMWFTFYFWRLDICTKYILNAFFRFYMYQTFASCTMTNPGVKKQEHG